MPLGSKEITGALNSLFDTLNGRRKNVVEAAAGAEAKAGVGIRVINYSKDSQYIPK